MWDAQAFSLVSDAAYTVAAFARGLRAHPHLTKSRRKLNVTLTRYNH
jgi:hypothetical protein